MESLIEQLLEDRYEEVGYRVGGDKEYKNCIARLANVFDTLALTLNEEQKKLLNDLVNCASEKEMRSSTLYFSEGFKLAYRLGAEACEQK